MKSIQDIGLSNVQAVYSGPEGDLWELIMGEQIHIGGFKSSMRLAGAAGINPGMSGIDLCCCTGAGMRFLVRFCKVAAMTGVDATERVIQRGTERCRQEGLDQQIRFVKADVCQTGLPAGQADFVWGEDAWCYVEDKAALIQEAARLVKKGGLIVFTDWVEGPTPMREEEAARFLKFMKFPNVFSLADYTACLTQNGCRVIKSEDTRQFAPHVDLYLGMLDMQLTYDALKIIGFNVDLMAAMAQEMVFMQELAHAGKIAQGLLVALKQ